jgi:hypothetical protein
VACALLCFAACDPGTRGPDAATADDGRRDAPDARPAQAGTEVRPAPIGLRPGHVLLDSAAIDVTGDGALDGMELHVEAELWRDGSVLWEDGHHWLLVARRPGAAADQGFVLLDEFIPHGTARFLVLDSGEASPIIVVEVLSATGGFRAAAYVFDAAEDAFVVVQGLEAEGRLVHRTPLDAFR